ncbi:MAG TPA: c-type cytochrome [Longimicrobiales bacterium]|nr:c-type cytochrome [Longimicrobiales bacterium]
MNGNPFGRRGRRPASAYVPAVALALLALALAAPARAQVPDTFVNLKVLPKNITKAELVETMRGFSSALGVRCQHCHEMKAGSAGAPGGPEPLDFRSDAKTEKQKARAMLRMVAQINDDLLTKVPSRTDPAIRVQCVTCHHGLKVPRTLEDTLAIALDRAGLAAAVQQYRDLRQRYYGSGVFDFEPPRLIELSRRLAASKRAPEALEFLKLNTEFYPGDVGSYLAMGDLYLQGGDKAHALESYRKVLELAPDNRAAKRRVDELTRATDGAARPNGGGRR